LEQQHEQHDVRRERRDPDGLKSEIVLVNAGVIAVRTQCIRRVPVVVIKSHLSRRGGVATAAAAAAAVTVGDGRREKTTLKGVRESHKRFNL